MTEPLLTTPALVEMLESSITMDMASYAEVCRETGEYPEASFLRFASGGGALWMGAGCPINGATGMGMHGPVPPEDVHALRGFFADRGEPARVDVCPLADASLLARLGEAGFVAAGFESQLARELPAEHIPPPAPGVEVREALAAEERELWGHLAAEGFADGAPTEEDLRVGRTMAQNRDARLFIGYLHGQPAGTGMLAWNVGIASLNADSTLPAARAQGVQSALLGHRLREAAKAGFRLARIEAMPGGTSQRNQERFGFQPLYTRVMLRRPHL